MAAHGFQKLSGGNVPPGIDNSPTGHHRTDGIMVYFQGNVGSNSAMGLTDEINDILLRNFHNSPYAGTGLITASNLEWLRQQEFPFIGYGGAGWGSSYAYLSTPIGPEDTRRFGLLVELLDKLTDYPLVDEELYYKMEGEIIAAYLTELAEQYSIDRELLTDYYYEGDYNQIIIESDFSPYLAGVDGFISEFHNWDAARLARLNGAVTLEI